MKIREIMSRDPVCCVLSDSAQAVAKILCDRNIGSMPVVASQESRKLVGMITDRDVLLGHGARLGSKDNKNRKTYQLGSVHMP
jgi:predicted transcriptional regulator